MAGRRQSEKSPRWPLTIYETPPALETKDAKHKDKTKGAEYQVKTRLAYSVIMNYEKETDCIQAETESSKNYKAGDKPDIIQAKTADVVEDETKTKQAVILQDETVSAKNYEARGKQNDLYQAKTEGAEYQAKTKGGVKNYEKQTDRLQAETKGVMDYKKQIDFLQAETGGNKNYKKQTDLLQAKTKTGIKKQGRGRGRR